MKKNTNLKPKQLQTPFSLPLPPPLPCVVMAVARRGGPAVLWMPILCVLVNNIKLSKNEKKEEKNIPGAQRRSISSPSLSSPCPVISGVPALLVVVLVDSGQTCRHVFL